MRKFILFGLLSIIPFLLSAQEEEAAFKKYTDNGFYKVDNGEIVVSKVIEDVPGTKEEIYGRVKSYFARSYGDANSVIQTDDKEGGLVIGKGLYTKLASFTLGIWSLKSYHILRVDIKDGRVRVMVSASTMIPYNSEHPVGGYEYSVTEHYPFTTKRATSATKPAQIRAFLNLVTRMNRTISGIEEAVKSGIIRGENEDW